MACEIIRKQRPLYEKRKLLITKLTKKRHDIRTQEKKKLSADMQLQKTANLQLTSTEQNIPHEEYKLV